jgi:hypothetical protein
MDRRLGGSQRHYGCGSKEKYPCLWWESNPGYPAHTLVIIVSKLSSLSNDGFDEKTPVDVRSQINE